MKQLRLHGLFGHLCASTGLYSKDTFTTLYGCITRLVRDHHLKGFVMTCTLNDPDFDTMAHALDNIPDLPLHRLTLKPGELDSQPVGYLLMLTDRLCAGLFWSSSTQDSFRLYEGGWTFHPGDTRTMASQLLSRLAEKGTSLPEQVALLEATGIDRRYDDKLNLLTTSLVRGLEHRNRELVIALDEVQRLNKRNVDTERLAAIGQLSSALAHEIRNPLGLIDLYAKLTEDRLLRHSGELGEDADLLLKNLAQIRKATTGLEAILTELTQYSRPLHLSPELTDLTQLARDVCDFYQPSYQEKGVTLEFIPPRRDSLPAPMSLDADKIQQALLNLLKNALESSTQGKQVLVSVMRQDASELFPANGAVQNAISGISKTPVLLTVRDEGCGISAHQAEKLFTPFFSTKGSEGTGLGLAHSRKILQAHGGSVELLHSTPGEGSEFALILPPAGASSEITELNGETAGNKGALLF